VDATRAGDLAVGFGDGGVGNLPWRPIAEGAVYVAVGYNSGRCQVANGSLLKATTRSIDAHE
jgi:hypothetical protein